jgi:hypothetical protein
VPLSLVTIITVTLDRPSLAAACTSVDQQTFADWHHFVIGDGVSPTDYRHARRSTIGFTRALGATEPTADMPFGTPDPVLRWALDHLDVGRFVCFLDDDNAYEPGFLSCMADALTDSGAGIALCKLSIAEARFCDGRPRSEYRIDHDQHLPPLDGYPEPERCDASGFLTYGRLAQHVGFPSRTPAEDATSDFRFIREIADRFGWVRVPDTLVRYGVGRNTPPPRSDLVRTPHTT